MILFHVANALFLLSYAVKDILWLRVITVLAGVTLLATFFQAEPPPWPAIAWNLVFFAINVARIYMLLLERRPIPLSADEQHLSSLVFRTLRPRELVRLLGVGAYVDHPDGTRFVTRGEKLEHLLLVVRGKARVVLDGAPAIEIGDGTFVGELGFLTGKPPGADVIATSQLRVLCWPVEGLRAFLDDNAELHSVMQQVLGADLAAKLRK
ncbi:MAG: cyclic nucleotide-binding domain-containing protein [Kofleriaceae bacterium]